jgi:hypothetical protein
MPQWKQALSDDEIFDLIILYPGFSTPTITKNKWAPLYTMNSPSI